LLSESDFDGEEFRVVEDLRVVFFERASSARFDKKPGVFEVSAIEMFGTASANNKGGSASKVVDSCCCYSGMHKVSKSPSNRLLSYSFT
jgi:hypothetical protein